MKRYLAAILAAMFVFGARPVVAGEARPIPPRSSGSGPFEVVPLPHPAPRSHLGSTACFLAGAGLAAGSFAFAHRADRAYDRYLDARAPADIERWFAETARFDRWSSGALLGGEALVGTGLYLRFLRRPAAAVTVVLAARSCALSLRF